MEVDISGASEVNLWSRGCGQSEQNENGLDILIREVHAAFDGDRVNVEMIQNLMENYKSNRDDWKRFAKADRYKYTRNLVDAGNGKFNLMLLCWGPSHQSTIHDHADAHCFLKVLDGSVQEVRYDWPEDKMEEEAENGEGMQETGRGTVKTNQVCYINDSMGLHRVENASHSAPAYTLHLYCPPFQACSCFDERTGTRRKCPVTFWSEFGVKCRPRKNEK